MFNGTSTFMGYLMPMPSLEKNGKYYKTHSCGGGTDEEVHTFLKGISSKMNVIERLKFEHAYHDLAVQHFSHYATETSASHFEIRIFIEK